MWQKLEMIMENEIYTRMMYFCGIESCFSHDKNSKQKVLKVHWEMSLNKLKTIYIYNSQKAKLMGATWVPPGPCRPQMGPMLAPWIFLSAIVIVAFVYFSPEKADVKQVSRQIHHRSANINSFCLVSSSFIYYHMMTCWHKSGFRKAGTLWWESPGHGFP